MRIHFWHLNSAFYTNKAIIFALGSILWTHVGTAQSVLDTLRWQHRVLLLFAPDDAQPDMKEQIALLTQKSAEVTDRDLVFFTLFTENGLGPDQRILPKAQVQHWRKRFGVADAGFTLILIGKDGTEKLRRREKTSLADIFTLIDAMPMRRAEMRKRGSRD